jgi:hypothetical protein
MRNLKKETIEKVIGAMKDTNEPDGGAVFEKTADVDFATFCAFVLTQYDNVTMEVSEHPESTVHLFYNGPRGTDHVASYITKASYGCETNGYGVFGGSRIAANNVRNSYVRNAFGLRNK